MVVEEVDESLTRDFSDEIWFTVLQFLFGAQFGDDLDECMRNPGQKFRTKNAHCLIPNFGLVSKSCLGCCHPFIRQVPLGLYQSTNDYHRSTLWLCRNNVKLGTIQNFPDNTLELCQWLYMLRLVNTSELKTIEITPSTVSLSLSVLTGFGAKAIKALKGGIPPEVIVMAGKHLVDVNEDDQEMIKALEAGIPAEVIVEAGNHTESEIEDSIVKTFQEVNPPLETLTLDIKNRSFYEPLLEMASQTLTHLTLDIGLEIEEEKVHNLKRLGKLIERLPRLEDLFLQPYADGDDSVGENCMKSRSLKELWIPYQFHVATLVSLKKLYIGSQSCRMAIHTLSTWRSWI